MSVNTFTRLRVKSSVLTNVNLSVCALLLQPISQALGEDGLQAPCICWIMKASCQVDANANSVVTFHFT